MRKNSLSNRCVTRSECSGAVIMPGNSDLPAHEIRLTPIYSTRSKRLLCTVETHTAVCASGAIGCVVSRHRVARLMKKAQIIPRKAEKWHPQTTKPRIGARIAPNLLDQDFTASRPNENGWGTSLTSIPKRVGCIWRRSWICSHVGSSVGRWRIESIQNLWKKPGRWPF